jgi:polar amino acid transport system permease protein
MLVLIFTIALVIAPSVADALPQWFIDLPIVSYFFDDNGTFKQEWRAITALSLIYGGYIAEIFRAGIESVDRGQVEAGRSLGLTRRQTSRAIVLPQALRAVVPPLGNDFIAVLKDTSLLSAVGVLEITLRARQYSAGSFKFRDSYLALTFIYLSLTVALSLVLTLLERRMHRDRRGARV